MTESERLDLPSASRFSILALCPASEQLRAALPAEAFAREVTSNDYAAFGDAVHKAVETENTLPLTEEQLAVYKRGMDTQRSIIADWQEAFSIVAFTEGPREERYWLWDDALKPITSAKLDRHWVSVDPPGYILIIDWKSLWATNLTPAIQNYQGRVQAVVVAEEYRPVHIRVVFNKAMFGQSDLADYDTEGLWRAEFSIRQALWEAKQAGAPFRAGDHCQYCLGRAYCAHAIKTMEVSVSTVGGDVQQLENLSKKTAKAEITRMVTAAPVEVAQAIFSRRHLIGYVSEAVEQRLRALPPEELTRLGLRMKPGRPKDSIKDPVGAFTELQNAGIDPDALWKCITFKKGDLITLIREQFGYSADAAERFYDNQLERFIARDKCEQSLGEL